MNTKIKTRKESYEFIKANNLQEKCFIKFNKNFTNCKTEELILWITELQENKSPKVVPVQLVDEQAREAIRLIALSLWNEGCLCAQIKEDIFTSFGLNDSEDLEESVLECPYCDEEIQRMLKGKDF